MIEVVTDPAPYDAYIERSAAATPFHRRAWGDAISAATGHRQHHLTALKAGIPVGALPLTEVRSRLFGKSLVSNGFAVGGGPLADDADALEALDGAARDLARDQDIAVVEYRAADDRHTGLARKEDVYADFVKDIASESDENLKAIPRKQRAEVRKSLKSGLRVETGSDERARAAHWSMYSESVRNLGTPVFPKKLFAEILDRFGDDADILTVFHKGAPVASVLSVYHEGTVYPYWGGGVFAARQLRANEHMYWMLMEHARERGCRRFDFGRSKIGTGPYSYKKNWGFEPQPMVYEYMLLEGGEVPDLNPNNPKFALMTKTWAKLPLWLSNRLGPLIAKDLA
ncbi:FemAB [Pacificimonas flava]|uniref:FemAB n=2 Tax=Pacificimonas TaxID=1960290 RepID=A0A219B809_9SPHN|nr:MULTISPECIES: FemAB family XrtA/PEP-CTERM system-associated protein [Pacificimonas]MBZ6379998.1 FemAB family PEP-CTERM system-associated protein [Pacificimonas aurantium]OWV34515.1 FemAB [Pacificimonas flava]